MGTPRIDLTDQRFGRWLVLGHPRKGTKAYYWLCRCDCGNEKEIASGSLKNGQSKSCGCFNTERMKAQQYRKRHGNTCSPSSDRWANGRSPEYVSWQSMIARCENPKAKRFERYGGRGITVCERWRKDFTAFLADMGPKPTPKHQIDRYPNNNGNYEKDNCRWATSKENAATRSKGGKQNAV